MEKLMGCGIISMLLTFIVNVTLVIVIRVYARRSSGGHDADSMVKYMPIEISRGRAAQQDVKSSLERGW